MGRVKVIISGTSELLMHSPKMMMEEDDKMRKTTQKRIPSEEAEKVAYRTSKGELFIPSTAISGCLIGASAYKKVGKHSLRPLIASAVRIQPDEILIRNSKKQVMKNYEIDTRTVVIKGRGRILRHRPKIKDWNAEFTIVYNENLLTNPDFIKETLRDGGDLQGLLDFSPRHRGPFGCFEITTWEVEK